MPKTSFSTQSVALVVKIKQKSTVRNQTQEPK